MNCAECRENLVACVEGLLNEAEAVRCRTHLETCAACRAEHTAIIRLQGRLAARGEAASEVNIVAPVMRRIRGISEERNKETLMSILLRRWGLGLGAAAGTAAILLVLLLVSSKTQATAAEIMAKGARAMARLTTVHLRGELRTLPADNFGYINADLDFCPVELWKEFEPQLRWRVEKPGRVVLMDGQSTVLFIKPGKTAVKIPKASTSAFDTDWLHRIANLSSTLTNELINARAKGWKLMVTEETGADGRAKAVVTVLASSGVPDNDYLKNTFFENADTRRVYRFDSQSELLEAVQVYLVRASGEVKLFELSQIDYQQPIDPSVWDMRLPADVSWAQLPQDLPKLPDNEKYASMTPEQAARAFFEACGRRDWEEAGKFMSPLTEQLKEFLGGVEIVSLGEAFTSKAYSGSFVPYEIRVKQEGFNVRMSNTNAAKRYVMTGRYDSRLQPLQESNWEPEILADNDAYARLSPLEAAQASFDALSKLDVVELRKFFPAQDVENVEKQLAEAQKQGIDLRGQMPAMEAIEAFWSPEKSAWFVKCRVVQVRKHNLALRKDNPAGRWQVDGGI